MRLAFARWRHLLLIFSVILTLFIHFASNDRESVLSNALLLKCRARPK